MRGKLALLRRAVEGLAAERGAIVIPDYTETLGRMQRGVDTTAERIAVINDVIARSPALAKSLVADLEACRFKFERIRYSEPSSLKEAKLLLILEWGHRVKSLELAMERRCAQSRDRCRFLHSDGLSKALARVVRGIHHGREGLFASVRPLCRVRKSASLQPLRGA